MSDTSPNIPDVTLDPNDWGAFRTLAHRMLDSAIDQIEGVRDRPVWKPVTPEALASLQDPLPIGGIGPEAVCDELLQHILPFPTGNTHPRFFGWVHGAGNALGIITEMIAASMNSNLGGRDHGAIYVERQVLEWCRQLFGFPEEASGLVVTGTSMATVIALAVARQAAHKVAAEGAGLVAYASAEAHSSVAKAFDLLGLGRDSLRSIVVDDHYCIDIDGLRDAIADDLRAGLCPFCVIGTAGTVNTGAVDNLAALAEICANHRLWFHVDGAFGALGVLSERIKPRLAGLERADSLAFDFHKWLHVPYDAGCVLVRDGRLHRETFSAHASYLTAAEGGLFGGAPWFCDYGPELSRGFRALKVWATFKAYGVEKLGESIWRNCRLAAYLADRVQSHHELELLAPVSLAIVCFRYVCPGLNTEQLNALNFKIVLELQKSGIAAPSTTMLSGRLAIRTNITNHRTAVSDVDLLVASVLHIGRNLGERPVS